MQIFKRPIVLAIVLLALAYVSTAQIGVQVQQVFLGGEQLDLVQRDIFDNVAAAESDGITEVGIDYWFKPFEERRIEFTPTLMAGFDSYGLDQMGVDYLGLSFVPKTKIYPMDFEGDCDCPTFSKDGNFLTKGFFLELAPGVIYSTHRFINMDDALGPIVDESQSSVSWRLGVGAGVDIGVSDLITITPYVHKHWRSGHIVGEAAAALLSDATSLVDDAGNVDGITLGLRVGVRLDHQQYGYRR
jgi:hypothetical protein